MSARKVYLIRFTVQGRSEFPLDMLRYDHCWPVDSNDASEIGRAMREGYAVKEPISVRLTMVSYDKRSGPTAARWSSFLWSVVPHSVEVAP